MGMIFKYKLGGHGPYTTWDDSPDSEPTTKSSGGSESDELGIKDIIALVKDAKLLPNDSAYAMRVIKEMFVRLNTTKDPRVIQTAYTQIAQIINNGGYHSQQATKAEKEASTRKGLSEIAITKDGTYVGKNEDGELTELNLELARSGKYKLLTNSELLALNALDMNYIFDRELLEIVENGIGQEYIHDQIDKMIPTLGSTQITLEGYSVKDATDIIAGLDFIKELKIGMPLPGLYKSDTIQKTLKLQIDKALNYVYKMLGDNALALLNYKTGSKEKTKELLYSYLGSQGSVDSQFKVDMEEVPGSKSGSGSSKDLDFDLNPVLAFVLGKGLQETIKINPGTSYEISVDARLSVLKKDGKNLGTNSTLADVTYSDFASALDFNNATFGGVRVNVNQGDRVLLRNADIYSMELPLDKKAQMKGIIKPDIILTKRMEKAEDYIRLHKITDPQQINKVYIDNDLLPKYDELGNLNKLDYARFGRISAQVEETALTKDSKLDETVREVTDDNMRDAAERIMQAAYKKYSMSDGWLGMGITNLWEGAIYIPIREDVVGASLGTDQYFKVKHTDDANVIADLQAQNEKARQYSNPGNLSTMKQ